MSTSNNGRSGYVEQRRWCKAGSVLAKLLLTRIEPEPLDLAPWRALGGKRAASEAATVVVWEALGQRRVVDCEEKEKKMVS